MTYDGEKVKAGRRPCTVCEIDQTVCSLRYGVGACTAAVGTTGTRKCYNTRETCQDPANFASTTQTIRLSNRRIKMTPEIPATTTIYAPNGSKLATSTDNGTTWTDSGTTFGTSNLYDIAIDTVNDVMLITGASGFVSRSVNGGTSWSTLSFPTSGTLYSIEYSSGIWVVSSGGDAYWSEDNGDTWTLCTTVNTAGTIYRVKHVNGYFFLCGSGERIESSTDGKTFLTCRYLVGSRIVRDIFNIDGVWFACGTTTRVLRNASADPTAGFTIVNSATPINISVEHIAKFGSSFYAYYSNTYLQSTDGISWSVSGASVFATFQTIWSGTDYPDGSILLIGQDGDTAYSTDGTTFSEGDIGAGFASLASIQLAYVQGDVFEAYHSYPVLVDVDIAPAELKPAENLGERGAASVVLNDFIHGDQFLDKYRDERTHDTYQGTFFTKLARREPFLNGRLMRIKRGWLDDDGWFKDANFSSRTYIIDKFVGPSTNDTWKIEGKDALKLADDKRAQAPAASTGTLAADIASGDTTLTVGSGEGAQYGTSGTVRIGDEIITFSGRSTDTLTGLTRGTDGSTAESHGSGDRVQLCLRYEDKSVQYIVNDLLVNYANVSASYLDTAGWETAISTWFPGNVYSALLTEPEGVRKLLNELCEIALIAIWWDDRDALVKMDAIRPPRLESALTLFNDANVIEGSVAMAEEPNRRISEAWVFYDQRDKTQKADEASNYLKGSISVNDDAENADQYGDVRVRRILSRWIGASGAGQALAVSSRLMASYARPPLRVTLTVDAKDNSLYLGDLIRLQFRQVVDDIGAPETFVARVISAEESTEGDQMTILAERTGFRGRYAFIGPNTLLDYSAESEENRSLYGFVSTNPTPAQMSDNSLPYKIV